MKLIVTVGLAVVAVVSFWAVRCSDEPPQSRRVGVPTAANVPTASQGMDPADGDERRIPQAKFTQPPTFPRVTDAHLAKLRQDILIPAPQVNRDQNLALQQDDAMAELAKVRTIESVNVLAELLFAPEDRFFSVRQVDGVRLYSRSFSCMLYLYKLLEGAPPPVNGAFWEMPDLAVWRNWWLENKDNLVFRDPSKPVPLPVKMAPKPQSAAPEK